MQYFKNRDWIRDIIIIALTAIIVCLLTCDRKETIVSEVKKQGKEVVVSHTQTLTVDSVKILKEIIANTKPKIQWMEAKPKPTHDLAATQPNYVYGPCDSTVYQLDTGTVEGVNYSIIDTVSGNKVTGRSVKFKVPQLTVLKNTIDSVKSLRVDTVIIHTAEKKKRFSVVLGAGGGFSPMSPMSPEPQIGIKVGVNLFSF